jgi:hypothetical protein
MSKGKGEKLIRGLAEKLERKGLFVRPNRRWQDNIIRGLKEFECGLDSFCAV